MSGTTTKTVIPPAEVHENRIERITNAQKLKTYSVYEIMERLRELKVYSQAKNMLMDYDLWERLLFIGKVRSDNQYFVQYYPTVKTALAQLVPSADIDAELEKCIAKED